MFIINPLKVDELIEYLFNHDPESVNDFQNEFSAPVLEICENISKCYKTYLRFDNQKDQDLQFHHITAHVYLAIESLYTSTKLLAHGFLAPSGNQLRIALESIALSALLSKRGNLELPVKRNKWTKGNFYKEYEKGTPYALPHMAIRLLSRNREILGLSEKATETLKSTKNLYNNHSHASFVTLRMAVINEDQVVFGGGYDSNQKDIYKTEVDIRNNFIRVVPEYFDSLYDRCIKLAVTNA